MKELANVLTPDRPTDRERAIVEAGRLIDALSDPEPNVLEVKDRLYSVSKHCRDAIREIRHAEALASGVRFTTQNEYLDLGI